MSFMMKIILYLALISDTTGQSVPSLSPSISPTISLTPTMNPTYGVATGYYVITTYSGTTCTGPISVQAYALGKCIPTDSSLTVSTGTSIGPFTKKVDSAQFVVFKANSIDNYLYAYQYSNSSCAKDVAWRQGYFTAPSDPITVQQYGTLSPTCVATQSTGGNSIKVSYGASVTIPDLGALGGTQGWVSTR